MFSVEIFIPFFYILKYVLENDCVEEMTLYFPNILLFNLANSGQFTSEKNAQNILQFQSSLGTLSSLFL